MAEEKGVSDYVNGMSLPAGSGLTQAKEELEKMSREGSHVLNLEQLDLTDADMQALIGSINEQGDRVRVLNLFLNELTRLPDELGKLTNLEELRVGCNPLISIPAVLFTNMKKLRYLDVGYGEALTTLPESLGECESLQELWAGNNRIECMPSSLCKCARLEVLQLYGNDLKSLSSDIGHLQSLRVCNVGRNQISELPTSLGDCQSLTHLYLYENDLAILPGSLAKLTKLEIADCNGNPRLGLPPREVRREGIPAKLQHFASRS